MLSAPEAHSPVTSTHRSLAKTEHVAPPIRGEAVPSSPVSEGQEPEIAEEQQLGPSQFSIQINFSFKNVVGKN